MGWRLRWRKAAAPKIGLRAARALPLAPEASSGAARHLLPSSRMDTRAARQLRAARESGEPEFITTPTRVESTGLVIPPIRAEVNSVGWRLEEDWTYEALGSRLTIPEGWQTDLATVPRGLRGQINSFEFGVTGPLLHDFLYDHAGSLPEDSCKPWRRFSRKEADEIFLDLMKAERVPPWRRQFGYRLARLAGWMHWGEPNRARQ